MSFSVCHNSLLEILIIFKEESQVHTGVGSPGLMRAHSATWLPLKSSKAQLPYKNSCSTSALKSLFHCQAFAFPRNFILSMCTSLHLIVRPRHLHRIVTITIIMMFFTSSLSASSDSLRRICCHLLLKQIIIKAVIIIIKRAVLPPILSPATAFHLLQLWHSIWNFHTCATQIWNLEYEKGFNNIQSGIWFGIQPRILKYEVYR